MPKMVFLIFAWCMTAYFSYAQQPCTKFWLSFGELVINSVNINDTTVVDPEALCEIHISSLHNAHGTLHFLHSNQIVPFSVQRGHCFIHRLTYSQIVSSFQRKIPSKDSLSIFVQSDSAISVSVISRIPTYGDATSLLPEEALDTVYYLIKESGPYAMSLPPQRAHDEYLLIATENNSIFTINNRLLCTLNRGGTYYFPIHDTISKKGRWIHSNHPFALFNVNTATNIPNLNRGSCDKTLEQYYPTKTCGKQFFVPVTYMGREMVQVLATEDHTNITISGGALYTQMNGVNKLTGLRAGEWAWIEIFHENNGCFISSDKPVMVCSFMTTHGYYYNNRYGDPSVVSVPATAQRVETAIIKPFDISVVSKEKSGYPTIYSAIVVSPTIGKEHCMVSVNNGKFCSLYGGIWKDHPSGWSYYDMPLNKDSTYCFSNNVCGLQAYSYGLLRAESYYMLASVKFLNLQHSFTINDTHYLSLPTMRVCEQEVRFRGEVHDSLSDKPGHIRWYIDSVEEISARDCLTWSKYFKRGTYHLRMEVYYEDGFASQSIESELHVVSMEVQIKTTPEYCHRSDGTIVVTAQSDVPNTLVYWKDSVSCTDSVSNLKTGMYRMRISDAYCEVTKDVFVDSVQGPKADFRIQPETANVGMKVKFTDQSKAGGSALSQWQWTLDKNTKTYEQHPEHIYTEAREDSVRLVVTDTNRCTDSTSKAIRIVDKLEFPNAYAPIGSDGQPNYFRPIEEKGSYRSFEMFIYNRWGDVVWKQHCKGGNCPDYADDAFWWDGCDLKGTPVSTGVYFWVVKVTYDAMLPPLHLQGSVTIFR